MSLLWIFASLLFQLPLPVLALLIIVLSLTAWSLYGAEKHSAVPVLHFKKSALTDYLLSKCSVLSEPFQPNVLLTNSHLQTIVSRILPGPEMSYEREFYQLKDKGIVALDWGDQSSRLTKFTKKSPIVIIIPGFMGTVDSHHTIGVNAVKKGFRCVVFNRRGCGGCPLTTPKLQTFGDPSDLRQVVKYIRGKYPHAPLLSVAYSTGAGLLLSYLGEYGSSSYLTAGACVSPGYDYQSLYTNNNTPASPYSWVILTSLKYLISQHAVALSKTMDVDKVLKCHNLGDFEETCFSKMYGYDTIEQYWDRNNPMRDVDEISIPVLAINSKDDPVCPADSIPVDLFKVYPNFMLALTENGGHDGFLSGIRCSRWADKMCLDYLQTVTDFITANEKTT